MDKHNVSWKEKTEVKEHNHHHHGCHLLSTSTRCQLYQPSFGYSMQFWKQSLKAGFFKQVLKQALAQTTSSVTISWMNEDISASVCFVPVSAPPSPPENKFLEGKNFILLSSICQALRVEAGVWQALNTYATSKRQGNIDSAQFSIWCKITHKLRPFRT